MERFRQAQVLTGTPHQTVISYCLFITSAMRSLSGIALGKAAVRGEAAVCRPQPNGPVSRLIPGGPLAAAMGRRLRSRFHPGSNPLAFNRGAASGPVRNLISEFAASGDLLAAPIAAAKTDVLARAPGNGPTTCAPATGTIFRPLRDSEFRLASGDNLCGLSARHKYGFPFDLIGYAETMEDASKMHAAHATFRGVGIDDRSGAQESMLEGVNRADIRLW